MMVTGTEKIEWEEVEHPMRARHEGNVMKIIES